MCVDLKDIWRSVLTSLLTEVSAHTSVRTIKDGSVYITGELPLFFEDSAICQLCAIDGLGIVGKWKIIVDENYILPALLANTDVTDPLGELSQSSASLWIIPSENDRKKVYNLNVEGKNIPVPSGTLYNYGVHRGLHETANSKVAEKTNTDSVNTTGVKQIIVDRRPWPIVYGPNIASNTYRIRQWLDRIHNVTKE